MYFHLINFTDACNTPYIASRRKFGTSQNIEEGRSLHTWEIGDTRENVLNDVIVLHKLGHCDLFSYLSLMNVLYNTHNQFYIFLFFVIPNDSILLKISGFHMVPPNKVFFFFSYRAQRGTRYLFLSNHLCYHPCQYAEIKLLVSGCADSEICV